MVPYLKVKMPKLAKDVIIFFFILEQCETSTKAWRTSRLDCVFYQARVCMLC